MPLNQPPFRADHVGSLLRPPALTLARADHKAGRIGAEQLRAAEDEAIREVVRMQQEIGLQGITDGELRRSSWHMDFLYQIGGVRKVEQNFTVHFHSDKGDVDFKPSASRWRASFRSRLHFRRPLRFLKTCDGRAHRSHDSVAQHDALPLRTRRHRRRRLSTHGQTSGTTCRRVCGRSASWASGRHLLHRLHQPRLSQDRSNANT